MSEDFDDIQNILNDILSEKKPAVIAAPAAPVAKPKPVVKDDDDFDLNFDDFEPPAAPKAVITKPLVLDEEDEDTGLFAGVLPTKDTSPKVQAALDKVVPDSSAHVFTDSAAATRIHVPIPTFTSADMMAAFDIRNVATLVTLQTNRWHAKVKDRQASRDAATANQADERAFETRKKLLVGADELLISIHKAIDAARIKHYAMTLPWSTTGLDDTGRRTGGRLLMNTLFFEYTQEMAKYRKEMEDSLAIFEPEYPNLIKLAQVKLGKRFDPREYPNPSSIRAHFNLSFDFQPIPKGEDFMGLPKQQLDKLAQHLNSQTQTMMENAMQENWVRLHDVISAMVERLSTPDKRFHATLVENVREAVRLTEHLNMTKDQRITDVQKYADKHLCQHDAEELRKNPTLRLQVAGHAKSALDMMQKAALKKR